MIQRRDILSIPFLKKSPFTGSYQGMRYRLVRSQKEEDEVLLAAVWPGPYSYEVTDQENMKMEEFPFAEEGICQCVDWLNQCWEAEPHRWEKSKGEW